MVFVLKQNSSWILLIWLMLMLTLLKFEGFCFYYNNSLPGQLPPRSRIGQSCIKDNLCHSRNTSNSIYAHKLHYNLEVPYMELQIQAPQTNLCSKSNADKWPAKSASLVHWQIESSTTINSNLTLIPALTLVEITHSLSLKPQYEITMKKSSQLKNNWVSQLKITQQHSKMIKCLEVAKRVLNQES